MNTNTEVATVPFYTDALLTARVDGAEFVALRPIVEALGLSWTSQYRKINARERGAHMSTPLGERYSHMALSLQTEGGVQAVLCIPLKKLNGWLFSVNPAKVKPALRDKVVKYQEECFQVLHDYWTHGQATRKRAIRPPGLSRLAKHGVNRRSWVLARDVHAHFVAVLETEALALGPLDEFELLAKISKMTVDLNGYALQVRPEPALDRSVH